MLMAAVERRGSQVRARRGGATRSYLVGVGREGGVQVPDIQRSRLLAAAVGAVEEFGYTDATVTRITERARVSRRTFYELFDNREQCLAGVLDGAVGQISAEIVAAGLGGLSWRERVRGGLWVILSFFDRERALARVCIVQSQRGAQSVLERRQEIIDRLAGIIEEGREESASVSGLGGLTGEGVVGAVLGILYARLLKPDGEPLSGLLGELMAMIVLPYTSVQVARRERARSAPKLLSGSVVSDERLTATLGSVEPLAEIPMRLTYRTARVLQDLAEYPGSSNRQVADRVGIHDQGQISKLLARLERFGLLANGTNGAPAKGEPNEWSLTVTGWKVTRSIRAHSANTAQGKVAS
jgi:AcrR family transcriptional regulator/DNA-binding MarR family transcriptional regulator